MADDYSPFGGSMFGNNNFGGGYQPPAPAAPQPEPPAEPVDNDYNADNEPVEEAPAVEEEKAAPAPKKRGRKKGGSNASAAGSGITRDIVERILAINELLSTVDDKTLGLLKAVSGIHPASSKGNVIAQLVDPATRSLAVKNIATEQDILGKLDDPFAIALAFASLTRDERKDHWNTLLSCETETAADIAGNDNGVFPNHWKDVQRESIALNKLYTRTKDDYAARLNDVADILANLK